MTTGLFARTATDARRHDAPESTQLRYIVIVSRDRPELLDEMARRFQNSPDTLVVSERRDAADSEWQRAIDAQMHVDGYVIFRSA